MCSPRTGAGTAGAFRPSTVSGEPGAKWRPAPGWSIAVISGSPWSPAFRSVFSSEARSVKVRYRSHSTEVAASAVVTSPTVCAPNQRPSSAARASR